MQWGFNGDSMEIVHSLTLIYEELSPDYEEFSPGYWSWTPPVQGDPGFPGPVAPHGLFGPKVYHVYRFAQKILIHI